MKKLIGKTIQSIEVIGDYDMYGDGERVTEVTLLTCTDGTEVYILGDGGDGDYYCTLYTADYNQTTKKFSQGGREFGQWID